MGRKKADEAATAQRERDEWQLGIDWARWLIAGNRPQALTMYGLVLEPGEVAYINTPRTTHACTAVAVATPTTVGCSSVGPDWCWG